MHVPNEARATERVKPNRKCRRIGQTWILIYSCGTGLCSCTTSIMFYVTIADLGLKIMTERNAVNRYTTILRTKICQAIRPKRNAYSGDGVVLNGSSG